MTPSIPRPKPRRSCVAAEEERAWIGFYRRVANDAALATEVLAQLDADAEMKRTHLALDLSCKEALRTHAEREQRHARIAAFVRRMVHGLSSRCQRPRPQAEAWRDPAVAACRKRMRNRRAQVRGWLRTRVRCGFACRFRDGDTGTGSDRSASASAEASAVPNGPVVQRPQGWLTPPAGSARSRGRSASAGIACPSTRPSSRPCSAARSRPDRHACAHPTARNR